MITDAFDKEESLTNPEIFYKKGKEEVEDCMIIFSKEIHMFLLTHYLCLPIGVLSCCNGDTKIYSMTYEGKKLAFYLSPIGSSSCGNFIIEASYIINAKRFYMFGSAGNLNPDKTSGKYVIPTHAYRDEGMSYHYKEPSDYIEIKNANKVAEIFDNLHIPYILGKTWTTDAFYKESLSKVKQRKEEGCLTVEMEVAGVQAVADYYGFELYDFLQVGDVLDDEYDPNPLSEANHDLNKLFVCLKLFKNL